MGMYNILHSRIQCPVCGQHSNAEVEFKIGYLELKDYAIGDKITWTDDLRIRRKSIGRRPPDGNMIGEGYAECQRCKYDYWVDILIENDVLTDVKVNDRKKGYLAMDDQDLFFFNLNIDDYVRLLEGCLSLKGIAIGQGFTCEFMIKCNEKGAKQFGDTRIKFYNNFTSSQNKVKVSDLQEFYSLLIDFYEKKISTSNSLEKGKIKEKLELIEKELKF